MRKYLKYLPILLIPFLLAAVSLRITNEGGGNSISVQNTRSASLTFDGIDDYVVIGNPIALQITGSISLCAWVKFNDGIPLGYNILFAKYAGSPNRGVRLSLSTTGNFQMLISGDGTNTIDRLSLSTLNNGQTNWIHIVGMYNASAQELHIYLDGALNDDTLTGTVPSSMYDPSIDIELGSQAGGTSPFHGQIADARIFNRALSPAEITRVYRGDIITDGLVAHWSLQEGGLSEKAYDVSGNDNHGDLTNFTLSDGWANVQNVNHYNQQMGHSTEILGSNLITNGGFDTADNWVVSSPWQISGGVASIDGSQTSTKLLYQLNVTEIGNLYKIVYTITSYTAGQVFVSLGTSDGIYRSATGTYTDYLIATINTVFYFNADSDFNGAVDDVFVKEITNDVPAGAKVPALADGSGIDAIGNAINNPGRGYNKSLLNVTN